MTTLDLNNPAHFPRLGVPRAGDVIPVSNPSDGPGALNPAAFMPAQNFRLVETLQVARATDWPAGFKLVTCGYAAFGDLGYGNYVVKTTAQAASDGDLIDGVGTGFTLSNGNVLVLQDSPAFIEQWGVLDEGVDYVTQITAICRSGRKVMARSVKKSFDMSDVASTQDVSIDLDLGGNTLVSTGANERIFQLNNSFNDVNSVMSLSSSQGRTTIQLNSPAVGIEPGGVLKLYSNDVINRWSDFDRERAAEYFVVESVDGLTVVCRGSLIFPHVLNPRCAAMKTQNTLNLKNINVRRDLPHNVGEYAVAIDLEGWAYANCSGIRSPFFSGQLLSHRSGFKGTFRDIEAEELMDKTTENAVGYVGVDYGSQGSKWYNLNGGKIRHVYTTGAVDIDDDDPNAHRYGGAVRCHVYTGVGKDCTNFAFDTHADAVQCEFHDITVYDAQTNTYSMSGGFQDRGIDTTVHKMTCISNGANISASGRAILLTTGSRGFRIGTLVFTGASGRGLETWEVTKHGVPRCRIDRIIYKPEKELRNLIFVSEALKIEIGRIDVYPQTIDRTYYGSGTAMIKLRGSASVIVDDGIHLWFNNPDFPSLAGSSSAIFQANGEVDRIDADIIVHCNNNTWPYVGRNINHVRPDGDLETPPLVHHCSVRVTVDYPDFLTDYPDYRLNGAARPDRPMITGLDPAGDLSYTFTLKCAGQEPLSTTFRRDKLFEPDQSIGFGPDHFFINSDSAQGYIAHRDFVCVYESQANTATVSSIEPPTYEGQTLTLCFSEHNESGGPIFDATILQSATGIRLNRDLVIRPGTNIKLIARELNGVVLWEPFFGTSERARELIQLSASIADGVITLNDRWSDYEEIIIAASADLAGTNRLPPVTYYTSEVVASDSDTEFAYSIETSTGTILINFPDTDRASMRLSGIGVVNNINGVWGRYRVQ